MTSRTSFQGLRELHDITAIDLRNNKMGPEGAIQLASVLKFAPSLQVEQPASPQPFQIYFGVLIAYTPPTLQVLNLGFNQIGVEGAQAIADSLSTFIRSLRLLRVNADLHVDKLRTESELELVNKGFREEESVLLGAIFKTNRSLKVLNLRLNHLGEEGCKSIAKGLAMMMKIEKVNAHDVVKDSAFEDKVAEILIEGVREAANPPDTTMVWDGKVQKRAAIEVRPMRMAP
jgi:Ran GTPase-activating protein (RanGAP) involved in mRNA processing and transport